MLQFSFRLLGGVALGAALMSQAIAQTGAPAYQAKITRTTMGIPHIKADSVGSVGYGYGYSFAQDNLCVFYDDLVTVHGERSRWFGPEGRYDIPSIPASASNLDSDFFWKLMATPEAIARIRNGASAEFRELTSGYRAGINRYIAELKAGSHPGRHAQCATAGYLLPLTDDDIYARIYRLSVLASSSVFMTEIANAAPPALNLSALLWGTVSATASTLNEVLMLDAIKSDPGPLAFFSSDKPIGSNAYGLGAQATADGSSMLFGNPHFPWSGSERFYMAHLEVPGVMNVQGASLFGAPMLQIGFNDRLAWSHTVSTGFRFAIYQLTLNPLNPTQYFYNGQIKNMVAVPITVQVKDGAGLGVVSRTLYKTMYGPVLTLTSMGLPILGWDNVRAYTMRDANEVNTRLADQFLAFNKAQSLEEFIQVHRSILGIPWVNTIAAGPGQEPYYGDISVVPNVPDELVARCSAPVISTVVGTAAPGLPVLLGDRADCQWLNDANTPPGIFGVQNLPSLRRADYVSNMNDSYWLTNPREPITGFDRIIGNENAVRTLRTRKGILQIERRMAGTDGLPGQGFTFDQLKDVVLDSSIYSGELALNAVKQQTCSSLGLVDIGPACSALSLWDGASNLDSRSFPLWREFWSRASAANLVWAVPFSPLDPVNTPRGFLGLNPEIRMALQQAQQAVRDADVALDSRLGDVQFSSAHNGDPIPVFGAPGSTGAFTVADNAGLMQGGYQVNYGNSYIQAVNWTNEGLRAEGFLTYSQSTDPANPHYRDFSDRYTNKQWLRFAFTEAEILRDRISSVTITGN